MNSPAGNRICVLLAFLWCIVPSAYSQRTNETPDSLVALWRNTPAEARINSPEQAGRELPGRYTTHGVDTGSDLIVFADHTYVSEDWWIGGTSVEQAGEWRYEAGLIVLKVTWTREAASGFPTRRARVGDQLHFLPQKLPAQDKGPQPAFLLIVDPKSFFLNPKMNERFTAEDAAAVKQNLARSISNASGAGWLSPTFAFDRTSMLFNVNEALTGEWFDPHKRNFLSNVSRLSGLAATRLMALFLAVAAVAIGFRGRPNRALRGMSLGLLAAVTAMAVSVAFPPDHLRVLSNITEAILVPSPNWHAFEARSIIALSEQLTLLLGLIGTVLCIRVRRKAGANAAWTAKLAD